MRIRSIKPEVHKDEELWDLEQETGLPIFRSFTGLWSAADREGRFEWRPRMLKAEILPYWDGDFSRVLDALATRGFLVKYACGTREYGAVRTFKRHQVINNRESASDLPAPPWESDESTEIPCELTRAPRVDDACPTPLVHAQAEGKGREGKGKEGSRVDDASSADEPSPSHVIAELSARYPDPTTLIETRAACALTRRNGKVTDSVWAKTLKTLDAYPVDVVVRAMETFCARYADGQKDERYLVGIARGELRGTRPQQRLGMAPAAHWTEFEGGPEPDLDALFGKEVANG